MKKFILTLVSIIALAAIPAFAAPGYWTAVSTGGSGGATCYWVTLSGNGLSAMGSGVVSGSTFSGIIKGALSSTKATYDCGSSASCVATYYNWDGAGYGSVKVINIAITSAKPMACL